MRTTVALAGCALSTVACTADADKVRPLENELFFPTGMVVAPDDSVAFVTNANSELRFDSGSITVLDLAAIDDIVMRWTTNGEIPATDDDGDGQPDCVQDLDHSETLTCIERLFVLDGAGVRIGNFATDIAVQDLGGGSLRVIVPTRGDPSIAWANWDGLQLSCSPSNDRNALCDDAHRLSFVLNDADLAGIPEEPFGVYADSTGEFAMVTHLTTGAVTLIDSPRNSDDVVITDILTGIFALDSATGLRGATGVVGSPTNTGIVYVGSRSEDRVQTFTVGRPVNGAPPFLLPGNWFFLDSVGNNAGSSNDTRGMTFSPDGSRLFLVNRKPPSLQVVDTTNAPAGYPRNDIVGATDICRQASTVAVSGTGTAERAYVTCFQDGQLYIVDPRGQVSVEDVLLVGRGPYAAAAARNRKKLYVTNFLEDTIAVIDIDPTSRTRNRVVLRIGFPRDL